MPFRAQNPQHPIILVTGANSGLGFAICQRLITQFSRPLPPDCQLRGNAAKGPHVYPFAYTKQLTLILACRSAERANAARSLLFTFMDVEVMRQRRSTGYDGHAEELRRSLNIHCLPLDLANMNSIFEFAKEACRQYPYITHLILNAGVLNSTKLDWGIAFRQLFTSPRIAVTFPRYIVQPVGTESSDGLGLIWQTNVFGHYCLARLMEPLLLANPYRDSRIEWITSADAEAFDPNDLQLRQTILPYQASKYQIDLVCTVLAQMASKKAIREDQARISHILVHPGVCHTPVFAQAIGFFLVLGKILSFYVARILGSRIHTIDPYKGAISAVHASIAPITILHGHSADEPKKFASKCTVFGQEYVDVEYVSEWEENAGLASDLVKYCEKKFIMFMTAHGGTLAVTRTDSGIALTR